MFPSPSGVEPCASVLLSEYTTLRLGGPAARFLSATTADEVTEAVRAADRSGERLLVLGGGSNLVIADEGFDGLVVRIATRGYAVDTAADAGVELTVEAGEDWDTTVARCVAQGYGGLECLSGIPGLVGATPVQNVGAYGAEIADVLISVDLLDRRTGRVERTCASALGLSYRSSVLKGTDSAVVLRARFLLRRDGHSAPIRYDELARTLGVAKGERVPVLEARQAVLELRRAKGMVLDAEDNDTWSAGSFFTNPIVPDRDLDAVLHRVAEAAGEGAAMPRYPAIPGHTKLSAAWLIEHAGFPKGFAGPGDRVSLSGKHTLALTNRGSASTADLLALARQVRDGVFATFGVRLTAEPVLVGCDI